MPQINVPNATESPKPKLTRFDTLQKILNSLLFKILVTLLFLSIIFGASFLIAYKTRHLQPKSSNYEPKSEIILPSPTPTSTSSASLESTEEKVVENYEACIQTEGSKILQTYPEICVTKDGERFTKPSN